MIGKDIHRRREGAAVTYTSVCRHCLEKCKFEKQRELDVQYTNHKRLLSYLDLDNILYEAISHVTLCHVLSWNSTVRYQVV